MRDQNSPPVRAPSLTSFVSRLGYFLALPETAADLSQVTSSRKAWRIIAEELRDLGMLVRAENKLIALTLLKRSAELFSAIDALRERDAVLRVTAEAALQG